MRKVINLRAGLSQEIAEIMDTAEFYAMQKAHVMKYRKKDARTLYEYLAKRPWIQYLRVTKSKPQGGTEVIKGCHIWGYLVKRKKDGEDEYTLYVIPY